MVSYRSRSDLWNLRPTHSAIIAASSAAENMAIEKTSSQVAAAILGASNVASNIYIYILYIIVALPVSRFFISQAYYKSDS